MCIRDSIYSDDEIGELSHAFNSMAHEINEGNKLRRQMFADISHELRTPLTVLSSKLEMTLDKNRPLDPVEVSALYDEVIRLNGLVSELQDLSKLEAGQVRITKTLIDFRNFFNDFFVLIQAEAEGRGMTPVSYTHLYDFISEYDGVYDGWEILPDGDKTDEWI